MLKIEPDIMERFMKTYGEDEQLRQAQGECGELIAVIQNYYRAKKYKHRKETLADVMNEAADVFFMIQQIRYLNVPMFDKMCDVKYEVILDKLMGPSEEDR